MTKRLSPRKLAERQKVIDELGQLQAQITRANAVLDHAKTLKAQIVAWADESYPAHQAIAFEGKRYSVQVSACSRLRQMKSMVFLFKLLGQVRFLKRCSITLKALEEELTAEEFGRAVIEEANAGERTVTAVLRAGAKG